VLQGHIAGSIHLPDGGDWTLQMPHLLSVIESARSSSGCTVTVVFHCMESVRRGPRCARRLFQELKKSEDSEDPAKRVSIKVLQGGADQWVRNFHKDSQLVEHYNNDIWGYLDD
jgi:rhodanese-related sulfurtransferase